MLEGLIKKAQEIEKSTNANLSGAFVQITAELTLDECESLILEVADNERKKKRWTKTIAKVRAGKLPLNRLRNDAITILENYLKLSSV